MRDLICSIFKNSDDYDENYMEIRFNLDDMIIVVRAVFDDNNKYYSQEFLDECLYKLFIICITICMQKMSWVINDVYDP